MLFKQNTSYLHYKMLSCILYHLMLLIKWMLIYKVFLTTNIPPTHNRNSSLVGCYYCIIRICCWFSFYQTELKSCILINACCLDRIYSLLFRSISIKAKEKVNKWLVYCSFHISINEDLTRRLMTTCQTLCYIIKCIQLILQWQKNIWCWNKK